MKVILDKEKCIGCRTCVALCSKYFEMKDNNKAHLKGSSNEEIEADDECLKDAALACPVSCIKII